MKWWKIFFSKALGVVGMKMASPYEECISSLEDSFSELSDDECFMAMAMLDSGMNCEKVFGAISISRRKRAFLRKLRERGFGFQLSEKMFREHIEDLKGSRKVDDIVADAYRIYTEQKEEKKKLDRKMTFGESKM